VPEDVYSLFYGKVNEAYGYDVCDPITNLCKFKQSCALVPQRQISFSFRLFDAQHSTMYKIESRDLLVDGTYFGDSRETCYVPVFKSDVTIGPDERVIFMGNIFTSNYYLVYDQSPQDSYD